ncbi:DUF3986 family protein [Macrococcoides caseolyticum]|uniref:DUF3986 family protein n=1 Tax=Macrococcoides caseolyticum TaxID=69966 RepID=UPI001F2B71E0|nr:DUF3986 family protein [Macrococcus caseolyticus]MCE4957993.1 DUF3986 family protein [Macrococcus caseolyticus]
MKIIRDLWEQFTNDTATAGSFHVGYYEDDNDIEAMAVLRYDELEIEDDYWGIYIFENQGIDEKILKQYPYFDDYGYEIIKVEAEELSFDGAVDLFYEWLDENKVIKS